MALNYQHVFYYVHLRKKGGVHMALAFLYGHCSANFMNRDSAGFYFLVFSKFSVEAQKRTKIDQCVLN